MNQVRGGTGPVEVRCEPGEGGTGPVEVWARPGPARPGQVRSEWAR